MLNDFCLLLDSQKLIQCQTCCEVKRLNRIANLPFLLYWSVFLVPIHFILQYYGFRNLTFCPFAYELQTLILFRRHFTTHFLQSAFVLTINNRNNFSRLWFVWFRLNRFPHFYAGGITFSTFLSVSVDASEHSWPDRSILWPACCQLLVFFSVLGHPGYSDEVIVRLLLICRSICFNCLLLYLTI